MTTLKNITATIVTSIALLSAAPVVAAPLAGREVRINTEELAKLPPEQQERVLQIRDRLEEIMAVDRSTLDNDQRKALRTEWKSLKGEMKEYNRSGSVIYISTAGLIIIILLLIIIL